MPSCVRRAFFVVLLHVLHSQARELSPKSKSSEVFDLRNAVQKFVDDTAKGTGSQVEWWDISARQDEIKLTIEYHRYKVDLTPGTIMYANPTVQKSVKEPYQEDFPNYSEKKGAFVLDKKLLINNRYSWSTDTALVSNYLIKVNVSPPPKMDLRNDVKETLLLDKDEYKSVDVPMEFQASRSEVVHPGTTLKARVVINETVTEYPWAVEVTIKGCIAVKYRQPVAGKLLHCYPVSNLVAQEKLLTRTPDPSIVKFTAKGKFSAVQHSGIKVEVEEEDTGAIDCGPSSDEEDDEEEQ